MILNPIRITGIRNEKSYCRGKRNYRESEDYRHNARHRDLYRKVCALPPVKLSSHLSFRVLDRNTSLGAVHKDDETENRKSENQNDNQHIPASLHNLIYHIHDKVGSSRNDTGEKDYRNTVSDTFFVNALSEPHNKTRTRDKNGDNDKHLENAISLGKIKDIVRIESHIISDSLNYSDCDRRPTCRLGKFSLSLFAAVLLQSFERRDGKSKKLNNNARVDVRLNS